MRKLTKEEFVEKSNTTHNNKYNYSLVNYINSVTKVKIICEEHGIYTQIPHAHMKGQSCPFCPKKHGGYERLSIEILKERCYKLHKDEYLILSTEYINNSTKIMIKHNKCLNEYTVKPIHFFNGSCCPNCYNKSKGENKIKLFLDENNISYKPQYGFNNCKHKQMLSFDFYLPELNTCIEYDGRQHFEPVEKFGGDKEFELTKIRDGIKNSYCENNNINLIRIPYTKLNKIEEILTNNIFNFHFSR